MGPTPEALPQVLPVQTTSLKRRACVECRQQKLRCDANEDPVNTCSRCRKFGIECQFSETFQRRKRHSKAQMQHEIDRLRRQAAMARNTNTASGNARNSPPLMAGISPISNESGDGASSAMAYNSPMSLSRPFQSLTEALQHSPEFEPHKINDCFNLFFKHYHKYLPVLEPGYTASEYFTISPFLFWAIVAVGARRYTRDPTMLGRLAPKVTTMALLSAPKIQNHFHNIQGMLLLCNWPFPNDTIYDDPTIILSGILMQLAVQNGLHMTGKRLDFVRCPIDSDESRESFRARLWLHCKVVCQKYVSHAPNGIEDGQKTHVINYSTNLFTGLQPHIVLDFMNSDPPDKVARLLQPVEIQRYNVQRTLTSALTTLMDKIQEHTSIAALIDVFDSQLLDNIRTSANSQNAIYLFTARLHVRAFQFFDPTETTRPARLADLYQLAIAFIDAATALDLVEDFALYSPEAFYRTLSLACCIIMRIFRSSLRQRIDLTSGESAFFSAVNLFKKRSIQNNDINSRSAAIMTQLWQSPHIFKKPDGTIDSLHVRVCNRGSMGVVYDCLWYWRQEFNGISDPYSPPVTKPAQIDGDFNSLEPLLDCPPADITTTSTLESQFRFMDNNTFLPEWEWFFDAPA